MDLLFAATVGLPLLAVAWVCGRPARCLDDLSLAPCEAFALRCWIGLGILGTVGFLIGQVYFTPALGVGVVILGLAALFFPEFRNGLASAAKIFLSDWPGRFSLAILVYLFIAGLADPVGDMGHDGISYHLHGPKVWLRGGQIVPILDHFHTTFPVLIETLFGFLMGATDARAVGCFGVLLWALLLLQVFGLGEFLGGRSAGSFAMAVAVAIPPISNLTTDAFVDVPFAAFALAALRVAIVATRSTHFLLAGLLLGFSAATKYTGLITVGITLPLLIVRVVQLRDRRLIAPLIGSGVVAALIASPCYVRNWLQLGTPIYPPPFLQQVFKPVGMSPEAVEGFLHYIRDERGSGMGRAFIDFVLLPWRLTFHTDLFHGAGGIGLLPLAFGWLGLWLARRRSEAVLLATWSAATTAAWFLTQQEFRFLFHAAIVAVVFGAVGAVIMLRDGGRWLRITSALLIVVSLGYGAAMIAAMQLPKVRAVISPTYAAERRLRSVPYAEAIEFVNRLPEAGAVLILSSAVPPFCFDRDYIKPIGVWDVYPMDDIRTERDAALAARRLEATFIFDARVAAGADQGKRADFVVRPEDGFKLIFSNDDARVYEVE